MGTKFSFFKKQVEILRDIRDTVKAVEKIAAANIHYLKMADLFLKEYSANLEEAISVFSFDMISHPFFQQREGLKSLNVVLTTTRGLCGSLVSRIVDFVFEHSRESDDFLVVGKRGKMIFSQYGKKVNYFFDSWEKIPNEKETRIIRSFVMTLFLKKNYSRVRIFYPAFKSLSLYQPTLFEFLPISRKEFPSEKKEKGDFLTEQIIFEPSKKAVFDYLLRNYLETVFFQKILETKLSELSARTLSMEQAANRSQKLIRETTRRYFRTKRENITSQINNLFSQRKVFSSHFLKNIK